MPLRLGGINYPHLRYGGVTYPNVRYGGVTYRIGAMVEIPLTPANTVVTANLFGYAEIVGTESTSIVWDNDVFLGPYFAANGMDQTLNAVRLYLSNEVEGDGLVEIDILGLDNNFKAEFVATGRIIFHASDGEELEVMIADADMTEGLLVGAGQRCGGGSLRCPRPGAG